MVGGVWSGTETNTSSDFKKWLQEEKKSNFRYPPITDGITETQFQDLWTGINEGDNAKLDKTLNRIKDPSIKANLMLLARTQWAGQQGERRMTPLMAAVATGKQDSVEIILQRGGPAATIGLQPYGNALTIAAEYGFGPIMSMLVGLSRHFGNKTPLEVVERGPVEAGTVRWLREHACVTPPQFIQALQNACDREDFAAVETLNREGGVKLATLSDLLPKMVWLGKLEVATRLAQLDISLNALYLSEVYIPLGKRPNLYVASEHARSVEEKAREMRWQLESKQKIRDFDEKHPSQRSFSALELAALNPVKGKPELADKLFMHGIYVPATWPTQDQFVLNEKNQRALISALINQGGKVSVYLLKSLMALQNFAVYADIVQHKDLWPKDVATIKDLRELVSLSDHPQIAWILDGQVEVLQDDNELAALRARKKWEIDDTKIASIEKRRNIAYNNFLEAVHIVCGGDSQIHVPKDITLDQEDSRDVQPEAGPSTLAKIAQNAKMLLPAKPQAEGMQLVIAEKKSRSKSKFAWLRSK